jgi:hypothetical protein
MNRKWIGVDAVYEALQESEPAALNAMAELQEAELQNLKRNADLLLEGLHDLPENALELELFKDMVKYVYGVGVFIEAAMMHKAKLDKQS